MRLRSGLAALALGIGAAAGTAAAGPSTSDPLARHQWALDTVGAARAWEAGTGEGIVVAVVDTGVDPTHEDLAGRLVAGWDMVDGDDDPRDCHGHGTFVAGIVAARTDNGRGVASVAPGARIMPVRALECDGQGGPLEASIRWAADHGAHVINISVSELTQGLIGPLFAEAVEYAWDKGAIPVVAAGNQFLTGSGFADEPALVVTATDRTDGKPSYSSGVGAARWGMAAPGGAGRGGATPDERLEEDVLSTWWSAGGDRYGAAAGTSAAAPHVAGAAAVLRGLGLTPQQTVDRLLATAVDLGASGRDSTFGHGRLDVAAAVAGLAAAPATPAEPVAPPPEPAPPPPPPPGPTAAPAPPPPSSAPDPTATPEPTTTPPSPPRADGGTDAALPRATPLPRPVAGPDGRSRTGAALTATGMAAASAAALQFVRRRARAGPAGR